MIEQVMIFMLGALSSGLLSLMVLPAFWRRAMRLSRRRLEALMPLSVEEIVAERDLLRAEFAAEQRRIEQKIEAQSAARAEIMVDLGRRAVEIAGLQGALAKLRSEHETLTQDHATAVRARHEAEAERGALLIEVHDTSGLNHRQRFEYSELSDKYAHLEQVSDEQRIAIAVLEAKIASMEAQNETLSQNNLELRAQLTLLREQAREQLQAQAHKLGEERAMLLKELQEQRRRLATELQRYETECVHSAALQTSVDAMGVEIEQNRAAYRELQRTLSLAESAAENAAKDAAKQAQEVLMQISNLKTDALASEMAAADYIEALQLEVANLKGALEAAQARHDNAPVAQSSATLIMDESIPADQAALLRLAITEIGLKVAAMAAKT